MSGLLVVGIAEGYSSLIGMNEIRFFQIAILKCRIPEIAGVECAEIEIRIVEIASIGIHAAEIGVDDDGTGKITVDHFAS